MMWQVSSGSYYSRINSTVAYSHCLDKARACLTMTESTDPVIQEHIAYIVDIGRVTSPFELPLAH